MKAPVRLAAYGAGLVVAFGAAFGLAGVAVPDSAVAAWAQSSDSGSHGEGHGAEEKSVEHAINGVSASAAGYALSPVTAPSGTDDAGVLSFRILDEDGQPVTKYTTAHEKDLHLIVVRTDGTQFRHVHPDLDEATGTWQVPSWSWDKAGTYRVYTDFTPVGQDAEAVTLSRAVEVAGDHAPVEAKVSRTDEVDGYTVTLDGGLSARSTSELTATVERNGKPVTALQPYLGAFGHLVALREGDLAYLHVHPTGREPQTGDTGGPEIGFAAEVPTAGRYLLYLDFQVDGKVRTAEFVVDANH
ncbi:heavy-metal-associated domain-containing protein [Mariniluteicoccus flavus]